MFVYALCIGFSKLTGFNKLEQSEIETDLAEEYFVNNLDINILFLLIFKSSFTTNPSRALSNLSCYRNSAMFEKEIKMDRESDHAVFNLYSDSSLKFSNLNSVVSGAEKMNKAREREDSFKRLKHFAALLDNENAPGAEFDDTQKAFQTKLLDGANLRPSDVKTYALIFWDRIVERTALNCAGWPDELKSTAKNVSSDITAMESSKEPSTMMDWKIYREVILAGIDKLLTQF